jgi:hypothetical protein
MQESNEQEAVQESTEKEIEDKQKQSFEQNLSLHILFIDFNKATETKIYNFERVNHFEYLRVTVSYDNEEQVEIVKRMKKGSKAMDSLNRMLKSREKSLEQRRPRYIGQW